MSKQLPTVRQANTDDADSIARLIFRSHTISFAPFASEEWVGSRRVDEYQSRWRDVLGAEAENDATFVAVLDGKIVGSVRVGPIDSTEFDAQLIGMHVDPERTGHGVGSLLMAGAIAFIAEQDFKHVELGVIAANIGARRFYERHGWVLVRELPNGIEGVPVVIYELV